MSRCKCEFFYAGYGDISVDPEEVGEVPQPLQEDVGPWDRRQIAVDAFTLMHHDLDVCTNSLQVSFVLYRLRLLTRSCYLVYYRLFYC